MRHRPPPRRAENYTNAFLIVLGAILFMAFWTIATLAGFVWVALTGLLIDRVIWLASARVRD